MRSRPAIRPRSAFSLVELLVVIAIISVLAVLVTPALTSVLRGNSLSSGGRLLEAQLARAHQQALSSGERVEVRFYKFADAATPGADETYRAVQLFQIDSRGKSKPISKIERLPDLIVINQGSQLSSLIAGLPDKNFSAADPKPNLPGVGASYTARAFAFRGDGSTELNPLGNWFVTVQTNETSATATTPPTNFYTVQVDPVNGGIKSYRP